MLRDLFFCLILLFLQPEKLGNSKGRMRSFPLFIARETFEFLLMSHLRALLPQAGDLGMSLEIIIT